MFAANRAIDARRESKIMQHNPHSIKTIQKLYDLLSYYSTIPDAITSKQAHFQQPNGIPVFLKGGSLDKILFGLTVALCAVGISNMMYTMYGMAYPAKKK